jgi:hypothetical protein
MTTGTSVHPETTAPFAEKVTNPPSTSVGDPEDGTTFAVYVTFWVTPGVTGEFVTVVVVGADVPAPVGTVPESFASAGRPSEEEMTASDVNVPELAVIVGL